MNNTLKALEKSVEKVTGKTARQIREEPLPRNRIKLFPTLSSYILLDAQKIVRAYEPKPDILHNEYIEAEITITLTQLYCNQSQ